MLSIIDCYTDEPAGLGVPPYINTYPRYAAGAAQSAGEEIEYLTIDDLRRGQKPIGHAAVVIAGIHTPGKYLSRRPGTIEEVARLLKKIKAVKILGGPASYGSGEYGGSIARQAKGFDYVIKGDIEVAVWNLLTGKAIKDGLRRYNELRKWAVLGAGVVKAHPDFPHTICEIETYRGCTFGGCSFCTEPLRYGSADFRSADDIVAEVSALYAAGIRHFRLGKQPCFYSYMAKGGRLNPTAVADLLRRIRDACPELKVLHIDNANPRAIAEQPKAATEVTEAIVKYCTAGNVAAFGLESADRNVIQANSLNSKPEHVMEAIRLLNKIGAEHGENGMPRLLPGLNFIAGLKGETKETFKINLEFLRKILAEGLLLRRINLRQVVVFPGTKMAEVGTKIIRKHRFAFRHFRHQVRNEIDRPMLKRLLPAGSVLNNLRAEGHEGKLTFARQIGSYPLLVGIPEKIELGTFLNAKVVDYGFRSVTAVPYPLDINTCSANCLDAVPGIGKRRARKLTRNRPLNSERIVALECNPLLEYL